MDCPVINAGDGRGEHPTQALLDALTIRRRFGPDRRADGRDLRRHPPQPGRRFEHARAAPARRRGAAGRARRACCRPTPACPAFTDFDEGIAGADVVMMLRIQRERMERGVARIARRLSTRVYGLTRARLDAHAPGAIVMHPGPMNRGVEIDGALADDPDRSAILEQVELGVAVRMACLDLLTREPRAEIEKGGGPWPVPPPSQRGRDASREGSGVALRADWRSARPSGSRRRRPGRGRSRRRPGLRIWPQRRWASPAEAKPETETRWKRAAVDVDRRGQRRGGRRGRSGSTPAARRARHWPRWQKAPSWTTIGAEPLRIETCGRARWKTGAGTRVTAAARIRAGSGATRLRAADAYWTRTSGGGRGRLGGRRRRSRPAPRPGPDRIGRSAPRKPALRRAAPRRPGRARRPAAGRRRTGAAPAPPRRRPRRRRRGFGREREADRLAGILGRADAEQGGDLGRAGAGPGEGRPLLHARAAARPATSPARRPRGRGASRRKWHKRARDSGGCAASRRARGRPLRAIAPRGRRRRRAHKRGRHRPPARGSARSSSRDDGGARIALRDLDQGDAERRRGR